MLALLLTHLVTLEELLKCPESFLLNVLDNNNTSESNIAFMILKRIQDNACEHRVRLSSCIIHVDPQSGRLSITFRVHIIILLSNASILSYPLEGLPF